MFETWRPLVRLVIKNYKKFTGQKPGNVLTDSLVKQQWWPLQSKIIANDYKLVKIAYHDTGKFICSFELSYSDGTRSPLFGFLEM